MTEVAAAPSKWIEVLTRRGEYYENIVVDTERYLQFHAASTVTMHIWDSYLLESRLAINFHIRESKGIKTLLKSLV